MSQDVQFKLSSNNNEERPVTCLDLFKSTRYKTSSLKGYGAEEAPVNDCFLRVPDIDTGFHKEGDVLVPNAGDYTVPNIKWVRIYCNQYLNEDKEPIDVSNLITIEKLDERFDTFTEQVINPLQEKLDSTHELCNNLDRWKREDLWILDGGSPRHTSRF